MKARTRIEPCEIETSEVLQRLVERAWRRQTDVIHRVLRKLEADPAWLDRVARGPKPEDVQ